MRPRARQKWSKGRLKDLEWRSRERGVEEGAEEGSRILRRGVELGSCCAKLDHQKTYASYSWRAREELIRSSARPTRMMPCDLADLLSSAGLRLRPRANAKVDSATSRQFPRFDGAGARKSSPSALSDRWMCSGVQMFMSWLRLSVSEPAFELGPGTASIKPPR